MNDTVQTEQAAKPPDALLKRIRSIRRSLARGAGRTPSRQLRLALTRASVLAARSEAAGLDPASTPSAIANLDRAARLAARDLDRLKAGIKPVRLTPQVTSVADLVAEQRGRHG